MHWGNFILQLYCIVYTLQAISHEQERREVFLILSAFYTVIGTEKNIFEGGFNGYFIFCV